MCVSFLDATSPRLAKRLKKCDRDRPFSSIQTNRICPRFLTMATCEESRRMSSEKALMPKISAISTNLAAIGMDHVRGSR